MSNFGKRRDGPNGQRWLRRKRVGIAGCAVSFEGCRSVLIEDISMTGARLRGRALPEPGTGVMVKAGERTLFGEVAWAAGEHRGIAFDFARR
jgi:hypothetical protein